VWRWRRWWWRWWRRRRRRRRGGGGEGGKKKECSRGEEKKAQSWDGMRRWRRWGGGEKRTSCSDCERSIRSKVGAMKTRRTRTWTTKRRRGARMATCFLLAMMIVAFLTLVLAM
jgi:hypothetical protein